MLEPGRICVKIAGREAGKKCIVVDTIDNKSVLVDGGIKRRKCSIAHLEPLDKFVKIKKNESHELVVEACKKAGIVLDTKEKVKSSTKKKARKEK